MTLCHNSNIIESTLIKKKHIYKYELYNIIDESQIFV